MNVTATDIRHKCPRDQPTSRVKSVKYVLGFEGDFFGRLSGGDSFGQNEVCNKELRLHGEIELLLIIKG